MTADVVPTPTALTTDTQPPPKPTITMNLTTVLAAARLFTDRGLPGLRCVQLYAGHGVVAAEATDRFTCGYARKPANGDMPKVLIDRRHVAAVIKLLRPKVETDVIPVTATLNRSHLRPETITFKTRDLTITVPIYDGTGPNMAVIFKDLPTAETSRQDGPIALRPQLLKTLNRVRRLANSHRRKTAACRFYFTPDTSIKPVRVEIGDWFLGAFMPVKGQYGGPNGYEYEVGRNIPNVPYGLPTEPEGQADRG